MAKNITVKPKTKEPSKIVSFQTNQELYDLLNVQARNLNCTVSELIRVVLVDYFLEEEVTNG